jgi:hypothetical protein
VNVVPPTSEKEDEARSLDIVQRVIISGLVIVVFGTPAIVLAVYVSGPHASFASGDAVGLWVMSGFIGLVAAATILFINRRRPYAPWVALGLLPMAVSAYWVLT